MTEMDADVPLSPAGVRDTAVRAFAVAYEKSCNHRYDMGAIRAGLEAAAKAQPRDYTDFDTWFHEQEGVSLRSERFNGDVEWLKAAFDAGRSAQPDHIPDVGKMVEPSIGTGQGEAVAVPLSLSGEAREAVLSYRCRLQVAFRRALSDLPEIAPPEVSEILSSIHMQDRFLDEGRRLQRLYGLSAVSPRLEQECGAGAWSFIRRGLLDSRPPPAGHVAVPVEPTHRHKKRGTEYVLIGHGKMQAEWWIDSNSPLPSHGVDMREVAIYRSATDPNEIWVRPREEFEDGRFEALPHNQGEGK